MLSISMEICIYTEVYLDNHLHLYERAFVPMFEHSATIVLLRTTRVQYNILEKQKARVIAWAVEALS